MYTETTETATGNQVFVRLTDKEIITTIAELAKMLQQNRYSFTLIGNGNVNFTRLEYIASLIEMEKVK